MEEKKTGAPVPEGVNASELAPELKEALQKDMDNRKKLAEIFSQCWDDERFQARFIEHPKDVMAEFNIAYDKAKDYVVLPGKEKTLTCVLPYENVNEALKAIGNAFTKTAENGPDNRRILPEGWSYEFIQNTSDTNYIAIPMNPEKLSPEELEMVNGGCVFGLIVAAALFVVVAVFNGAAIAQIAAINNAVWYQEYGYDEIPESFKQSWKPD